MEEAQCGVTRSKPRFDPLSGVPLAFAPEIQVCSRLLAGGKRIRTFGTAVNNALILCHTFLAALAHDRITAPCVIDGPINGTSFRTIASCFV
jgi:hypothetical protein